MLLFPSRWSALKVMNRIMLSGLLVPLIVVSFGCATDPVDSPDLSMDAGLTCEVDQVSCDETQQQIKICNTDGASYTLVPCAASEFCRAGACFERVCEPNATECVGRRVQVCNAIGSGYMGNRGTNCEAADMWCRGGECVRALCEPECSASEYCSPQGECLDQVCSPLQRSCSDNNEVLICNAEGSAYADPVDCTATNQRCFEGNCMDQVCGNGIVETGEQCDDGNQDQTDDCLNDCRTASCGDRFVQVGVEDCDDGNQIQTDACLSDCSSASCGDGYIQAGVEECDDANQVQTDACLNSCIAATCGDSHVQEDVEECDDGNQIDDDECTNACTAPLCVDNGMLTFAGSQCVCIPCGPNRNNHYLELTASDRLSGAEAATIEFYARLDAYSQYGLFMRGVRDQSNQNVVGMGLRGDCRYGRDRNTLIASWGSATVDSLQTAPLGVWQHYALTFNRGRFEFFINGVSQGSSQADTPVTPAIFRNILYVFGAPFTGNNNCNYQINGALRSVRMSHVQRYTQRFQPPDRLEADADTLQLYALDEMQGNVVVDSVSNQRGAMYNAPRWELFRSCP